jgi:hypothetical protein
MSTINSNLLIGKKDNAFFIANPTLVLLDGQLIYNEDTGELFIGDGVTQLSALTAINGGSGSYTFQNGLTESGGNVELGGNLTQNTTITTNFDLTISGEQEIELRQFESGNFNHLIKLDGFNGVQITADDDAGFSSTIQLTNNEIGLNTVDVNLPNESANGIVLTDNSNNLDTLVLGANQSIRRNSANTAYEAFVPLTETSTNTLTNKRITARASTEVSSATPTINTDNVDYYSITALATNITSFTTNLSGTPTIGQTLWISITDNAVARTIAWGASFQSSGNITLPTTTIVSTRLDVAFIWNEAASVWRCVGVA